MHVICYMLNGKNRVQPERQWSGMPEYQGTSGWMDRWMSGAVCQWMGGAVCQRMDGWTNGPVDTWTNGWWTSVPVDGRSSVPMDGWTSVYALHQLAATYRQVTYKQ